MCRVQKANVSFVFKTSFGISRWPALSIKASNSGGRNGRMTVQGQPGQKASKFLSQQISWVW
jgi:hypothetical protein